MVWGGRCTLWTIRQLLTESGCVFVQQGSLWASARLSCDDRMKFNLNRSRHRVTLTSRIVLSVFSASRRMRIFCSVVYLLPFIMWGLCRGPDNYSSGKVFVTSTPIPYCQHGDVIIFTKADSYAGLFMVILVSAMVSGSRVW